MQRSTAVRDPEKMAVPEESLPDWLQADPRWILARRVVCGSHFARSALLSRFLLFVVAETLESRAGEITEHQIGVQVFDRPAGYRTVEDNIVRNYARQLRKRLAEHFAGEGRSEPMRIEIPLGGYVPVFVQDLDKPSLSETPGQPIRSTSPEVAGASPAHHSSLSVKSFALPRDWKRWLLFASLVAVYSVALIGTTWFTAIGGHLASRTSGRVPARGMELTDPLWTALFDGPLNCYIVPADAGFNLLEDLSHRPLPLANYIQGDYLGLPLAGVDAHSADDLRSQQFTSFVDFQIVASLARLPQYSPERTLLRFPRDLRLDDLKSANAVLIGSVGSNPWAAVAEGSANFRINYRQGMQGATIVNTHPQPGEALSYASHWNEPAHETFALIAFLPNLGGNGHLLLLQGLDVAGTQAAAETLFHQNALAPVLRRAVRSDGSLRHFEVLLRSTSIESNSTGAQVVASRIY